MVSLCEGLNEMQCQLKQQHNRMAALCDQTHALQLKHSDQAMKKGWSQLEQQVTEKGRERESERERERERER